MKIELKIDNEKTELSQKEAVGSVSDFEIYLHGNHWLEKRN